jgi:hypothetical protein
MNKTLEAWLRGYFLFDVNGKKYFRYNSALTARKLVGNAEPVGFTGLHVFKGWIDFYMRVILS